MGNSLPLSVCLVCSSSSTPGNFKIFPHFDPVFDTGRVCIRIPGTWEGFQACRVLEATGTITLATTLFTLEQTALAGAAKCHYVAPYVNELRVHTDADYHDPNPQLQLCVAAQRYYLHHNQETRVLPASLVTMKQVMLLSGVKHMSIAPKVLKELAETSYTSEETKEASLFVGPAKQYTKSPPHLHFENAEAKYRMAVTRSDGGENERKLTQAINIFCDMQTRLEEMMKKIEEEQPSKDGVV